MAIFGQVWQPKSLYISHAVSNFYGTEIEIWAAYEQLLRVVFSCLQGQFLFIFSKYFSVHSNKLHKMNVKVLDRLQTNFQLCLALLEIPHSATLVTTI